MRPRQIQHELYSFPGDKSKKLSTVVYAADRVELEREGATAPAETP